MKQTSPTSHHPDTRAPARAHNTHAPAQRASGRSGSGRGQAWHPQSRAEPGGAGRRRPLYPAHFVASRRCLLPAARRGHPAGRGPTGKGRRTPPLHAQHRLLRASVSPSRSAEPGWVRPWRPGSADQVGPGGRALGAGFWAEGPRAWRRWLGDQGGHCSGAALGLPARVAGFCSSSVSSVLRSDPVSVPNLCPSYLCPSFQTHACRPGRQVFKCAHPRVEAGRTGALSGSTRRVSLERLEGSI